MGLDLIFSPDNLIKTRKEICSRNNESEIDFINPSAEMEVLIRRLSESSEGMTKASAYALSDREVMMLAGYLPYNYYEVSEEKLFEMLKFRLNDASCRTLFRQWQECYDNPVCNSFIRNLALSDREFKKLLSEHHIPEKVFVSILESRNIPLSYNEELIGRRFVNGADFESKLRYYGVAENSVLDIDCKRALMTFCGRADYLECSEENILYIIRGYDLYMLRRFLSNFLSKLSLWELQVYPQVAEYIRGITSHKKSKNFAVFFENAEPSLIEKYLNWINIYKINEYFGNDERSRFWKQYRFENVIRYPVSNVVVMEFDQYIAVEFPDQDNGTIYICDKHSFRQYFYLRLDSMDEPELIAYFEKNKNLCVYSRSHTGKWQSHTNAVISKRQMGEKLPK